MLRRLSTFASALSLLVCAMALVLWPRSYGACFDARYVFSPTPLTWWGGGVSSTEGLLFFGILKHDRPHPDPSERGGFDFQTSRGNQRLWSWAFAYLTQMTTFGHRWHQFGVLQQGGVQVDDETESVWAIMLPHWFVALVFALPPTIWLIQRVRRLRRHGTARCHVCGYDLRASPDRCPECGTPVNKNLKPVE